MLRYSKNFSLYLFTHVCVCVCVWCPLVLERSSEHIRACVFEDRQFEVLSFHYMGPGDQTQVIRLDSNHLYLLSHLAGRNTRGRGALLVTCLYNLCCGHWASHDQLRGGHTRGTPPVTGCHYSHASMTHLSV